MADVVVTDDQSGMRTTFDVESTYPEEVEYALAHVVFRDSSGDIVGGHAGNDTVRLSPDAITSGAVDADGLLDIDEARTEVYLDPMFL